MTPLNVIIPTALVFLNGGRFTREVRVLLSPGSPHSIILTSTVDRMKLAYTTAFGEHKCQVRLQSRYAETSVVKVSAYMRSQLNVHLPRVAVDEEIRKYYDRLPLADPQFHNPKDIEMVLGADIYSEIVRGGIVQSAAKIPTAFSTAFGWAIVGTFTFLDIHH